MAEVNDKGEVTVEGEFIGRLEGFRFRQDQTASADEARTLRQAAVAALAPAFNLRADKFYNAPDTEMEFTEQGGLMWGTDAVGKLVAGADAMRPQVEAFVDDEAGPDVAEKVRRRLQHFIDRKVAALFEPLLNLQRDETLTGLARGFAFQLVEALGILPRDAVAADVKALDQDARALLRKHGVRFGQFTIFLPALLKPAPTRLRLVLWSLANGVDVFPESPPPGLVTIPNLADVPGEHYALSGYRPAGARAIRIDMLERLADLLRARDTRAGFEAAPEMLSITGMTLEQFADLMQGLGYAADKGERPKVRAVASQLEATAEDIAAQAEAEAEAKVTRLVEVPVDEAIAAVAAMEAGEGEAGTEASAGADPEAGTETGAEMSDKAADAPELEIYYTFRWAPRPRPRADGPRRGGGRSERGGQGQTEGGAETRTESSESKPRGRRDGEGRGGPKGKGGKGPKGKGAKRDGDRREQGGRSFSSGPERKRDRIDPDNPFAAALMGLKGTGKKDE